MRGRLITAVLALVLLPACHGTPRPQAPRRPPLDRPAPATDTAHSSLAALRHRVEDLANDPSVSAGTWGIDVRSLKTSESIVQVNAARLLTPASSLKLLTLAVAADQLGWDFTYETRVVSDGRIENGVLTGDLVIVGSGDPSLDDWDGAATAVFHTWAARLKELGVRSIAGRIVGDGRAFSDEGLGTGWAWDDLAFSYSAPARGLQLNENAAQVVAVPGPVAGAAAIVALRPSYADVMLKADVRTAAPGTRPFLLPHPDVRSPAVILDGSVPVDGAPISRALAVVNPVRYYATAVREALRANGVGTGDAVDIADLAVAPPAAGDAVLMTHRSATLTSLADTMMRLSQNLYAESLLRTLGSVRGGGGTAEAGRTVMQDTLTAWGIPTSDLHIVDGSGLSRYNLLTPRAIASALAHVYGDARLRDAYIATLPRAGRTGTLANRMKGTAAEGIVSAKTGSFSNARAIAGFVTTADEEPLVFSIIVNNYGVSAAAVDRISDAIIVNLAEFTRTPEAH